MIYLNHAGTSWPKPALVRAAVAEALAAPAESWPDRLEEEHAQVCRAFGVVDSSRLLVTPGATSALATAMAELPWETGDRLILSGLEHHALYGPALQLTARGVEVVVAPRSATEPIVLEALESELQRGGVRLVAITAASNVTGEILPIESVIELAHAHGARCLIDAAQIAGWIPIDVEALGADLLVFAGHKGPQAPWGVGGLYAAPGVAMPGHCDVGSIDRAGLAGLVAGLHWLAAPERIDRLSDARQCVARLSQRVAENDRVTLYGPWEIEARMPTVALTVEGVLAADLASALATRGVVASGGLQCAPLAHETLGTAPDGVLRLSFGPSNDASDAETAAEALLECIAAGPGS